VQKSKDNLDDIIKVDDIELREKWLEQEKEAIELLKEKVALEKELFEIRQRQNQHE